MIAVSNAFKTACNSDSIVYKEYIVIGENTVEIEGKMSNTCYKNGNFIGTFNLKILEFETENDVDYKKKELVYYKSVNGEAIKIGTYIVTSVTDNDSKETVKVTAMDYGLKFAVDYVTELDYASGTITLFDVLEECCTKCSVTLKNETIPNGDFVVDSNQFAVGTTYGDVIAQVAAISGNFATITDEDKLELLFTTETSEIIEDYEDLDDKRDTHPITSVSLGISNIEGENVVLEDQELIDLYGQHWLNINDCPFAYTEAKRTELITAIFNRVKGFGYSSFESKYAFKPYMQLGDLIQFKNKAGDLVNSIVLKIDTKYDEVTLSAPSIIDATIEYKQPLSAIDLARRTEIIVNKQESEISAIVSTTDENSENITELLINADTITERVETTESSINSLGEAIETINSTIVEQTDQAITTWFNVSGIQGILDDLTENVDSNNDSLNTIQSYIKESIETDVESPYYGLPYIELGKTGNETRMIIRSNRISFMTGTVESAYINQSQLYITDSTILNKLQVGNWEMKPDEFGNLNMRWVGES